jgi:hypothetical protein
MRQTWTDERPDELDVRVGELSGRVGELNLRFDALQRTLIQVGMGIAGGVLAVIATLNGLIATQL